jgi:hypothetical protein
LSRRSRQGVAADRRGERNQDFHLRVIDASQDAIDEIAENDAEQYAAERRQELPDWNERRGGRNLAAAASNTD